MLAQEGAYAYSSDPAEDLEQAEDALAGHRPAAQQFTQSEVLLRFRACGRCSMFLAGYQVLQGAAVLETALATVDAGWLALPWASAMRELINKSYGCRVDIDALHYESCCPECQRLFGYTIPEATASPVFQIRV